MTSLLCLRNFRKPPQGYTTVSPSSEGWPKGHGLGSGYILPILESPGRTFVEDVPVKYDVIVSHISLFSEIYVFW